MSAADFEQRVRLAAFDRLRELAADHEGRVADQRECFLVPLLGGAAV